MLTLSAWPFRRVLLASFLWVAANGLFFVWQAVRAAARMKSQVDESGIAASTADIGLFALVAFVPPLIVLITWYAFARPGNS